jgi:cell wall-associated NlpC family hydrolase
MEMRRERAGIGRTRGHCHEKDDVGASLSTMRASPIAVLGCLAAMVAISGCGEASVGDPAGGGHTNGATHGSKTTTKSASAAASPYVAAVAGSASAAGAAGAAGTRGAAGTGGGAAGSGGGVAGSGGTTRPKGTGAGVAHEVADPEEAKSFPLPASVHHRAANSPNVAAEAVVAPGARSDAQVRKELGEEEQAQAQERAAQHRALTPVAGGFSIGGNGTIPIPTNVPEVVERVIAGGNAIADFPYIWGGGHASFVANGYDCSGSVSYALAAGGLLGAPLVSGELANWGEPGPGRWITIYANAGHTFMNVDGVWFDTAGRSGPYASRWLVSTPPLTGYTVRHPPGL